MPLGGFCPLPLRLGGTAENGIHADQWNRLSLDVSAMSDGTPLAVAVIDGTTVLGCLARGGNATSHVTATAPSAVARVVTLPGAYTDEESGIKRSQYVAFAIAHELGTGPAACSYDGNAVTVATTSATSTISIAVFGSAGQSYAGDYGGDPDKFDSYTEGDVPYAYQWYREIVGAMGSAYSQSPTSLVTFEFRAQARLWAYVQRLAELEAAQQNPGQSDALLGRWANIMALPKGQEDWRTRRKAAARFALFSGVTNASLELAVRTAMGPAFNGFIRYPGTLDAPPDPTYWPEGNPGLPALDLGGGTWMSQRMHLTVDMSDSAGFLLTERASQITRDLAEVLDGALPAVVDWDWSSSDDGGFEVDVSGIGVDAL